MGNPFERASRGWIERQQAQAAGEQQRSVASLEAMAERDRLTFERKMRQPEAMADRSASE